MVLIGAVDLRFLRIWQFRNSRGLLIFDLIRKKLRITRNASENFIVLQVSLGLLLQIVKFEFEKFAIEDSVIEYWERMRLEILSRCPEMIRKSVSLWEGKYRNFFCAKETLNLNYITIAKIRILKMLN